jgi:hypothetical protein
MKIKSMFEIIAWIGYALVWYGAIALSELFELKLLFLGLALAIFGLVNATKEELNEEEEKEVT